MSVPCHVLAAGRFVSEECEVCGHALFQHELVRAMVELCLACEMKEAIAALKAVR